MVVRQRGNAGVVSEKVTPAQQGPGAGEERLLGEGSNGLPRSKVKRLKYV